MLNLVNHYQIRSRMRNTQANLGVVVLIGLIGSLIAVAVIEDSFIWVFSYFVGLCFWFAMKAFLRNPKAQTLRNLKIILGFFVSSWILAVVVDLMAWEDLYVDTALGILLVLVATFLMNQFNSDVQLLLDLHKRTSPKRQTDRPPVAHQPSKGKSQLAENKGLAIGALAITAVLVMISMFLCTVVTFVYVF